MQEIKAKKGGMASSPTTFIFNFIKEGDKSVDRPADNHKHISPHKTREVDYNENSKLLSTNKFTMIKSCVTAMIN
jgi:hypothetical protein